MIFIFGNHVNITAISIVKELEKNFQKKPAYYSVLIVISAEFNPGEEAFNKIFPALLLDLIITRHLPCLALH